MIAAMITALVIYALFQIGYYVRHGHIKEIIIFLPIFFISVFYLVLYVKKIDLASPSGWIILLYEPIAKLIFNIPGK